MQITLLTTDEACTLLRCERGSLKLIRTEWIEGAHYFRRGRGPTAPFLYNQELILDWLANQQNPETHQSAIESFRRSLPSGRKRRFISKVS